MAYVADAVGYASRQVTISRFLNGVVLAQVLAGPVGGVFGEYLGWRGVFLLLAAGALLVALAMARRIASLPDRRGSATFSLANYVALLRPGVGRLVLLAALIDGIVLMGSFPFLAPYMHEAFGLSYASVGLVLACFGLGAFGYIRSAAWLVPRLGEPGMVLLGGTTMAAAVAVAVLTPAWPVMIPVQARWASASTCCTACCRPAPPRCSPTPAPPRWPASPSCCSWARASARWRWAR